MKQLLVGVVTSTALTILGAAVQAQAVGEPPDLTGSWKGIAEAVSLGANPYRTQEGSGPYFSDDTLDFTFTIDEQRGERFAGTLGAGERTEPMIGGLMPPDFTSGVFLDDDGRYVFEVRDDSTIDLCYDHIKPKSKVVACYSLTRQ